MMIRTGFFNGWLCMMMLRFQTKTCVLHTQNYSVGVSSFLNVLHWSVIASISFCGFRLTLHDVLCYAVFWGVLFTRLWIISLMVIVRSAGFTFLSLSSLQDGLKCKGWAHCTCQNSLSTSKCSRYRCVCVCVWLMDSVVSPNKYQWRIL